MAGREPFKPDESQRLLLALAEQLRHRDQAKGPGETLASVAPPARTVIPADAYRFARRVDHIDEWLRTRGGAPARPAVPAHGHAGAAVHGMSAAAAVQPDGLKGIDVWAGNGQIDWRKVKDSGIDFVYVRAAYGTHPDKFAADYLNSARAAGLLCGVYHFLRTSEDYDKQIAVMVQQLARLEVGKGDLPPAVDVEDNPHFDGPWDRANNAAYLDALQRWIAKVRSETGAAPMLYTRAGFWAELDNPAGFADCPLWVANYGVKKPSLPEGWPNYTVWQYSESGAVPGIAGEVDLNSFAGTMTELQALTLK
jgi:GH25 family lysozyme M1 (1,4-beta-N-acetylmuramidase)